MKTSSKLSVLAFAALMSAGMMTAAPAFAGEGANGCSAKMETNGCTAKMKMEANSCTHKSLKEANSCTTAMKEANGCTTAMKEANGCTGKMKMEANSCKSNSCNGMKQKDFNN